MGKGEAELRFDQVVSRYMSRLVNGNKQFIPILHTENGNLDGLCLALS